MKKIQEHLSDGESLTVSAMYMRKQGTYTENRIFPFAGISDLRSGLLTKVRKLAANQRADHPWMLMDDMDY